MKKILLLIFAVLFAAHAANAQDVFFQTGHTCEVSEVRFSPDDSQLISYSWNDGNFILWDVKSGRQIWTKETYFIHKADENIHLEEFYWSRDGKTLVTKSIHGTYQTWEAKTGAILELSENKPDIEVVSPDKKDIVLSKDYEKIRVFDSETGAVKEIERLGGDSAIDTSHDETMIAQGGSFRDAAIKITNLKTGKSWWLDAHPGIIHAIEFSPDGKFFAAAGSGKNIYVFDAQKHNLVKTLVGHQKTVDKLAFSLDGNLLVSSAAFDDLKIWDWRKAQVINNKKADDELRFTRNVIVLDVDAKHLITTYGAGFEIRDARSWKVLREFKIKEKFKIGDLTFDSLAISSIQRSKNGKYILANYEDGRIRVWDLNQSNPVRVVKYADKGCRVQFTADEKIIIAVCGIHGEQKIELIDFITGKIIRIYAEDEDDEISFNSGFIEAVAVSPNGKYFLTSDIGSEIVLWDINKLKPIKEFEIGFSGNDSIAFSPDGKTFVIGGENQNLFLFNVETGEKLWQLIPSYQPDKLEIQLEEKAKQEREKIKQESNLPK